MHTSGMIALALTLTLFSSVVPACAESSQNTKQGDKYGWEKNISSTPAFSFYNGVTGGEKYKNTFSKTFPKQAPVDQPQKKSQ